MARLIPNENTWLGFNLTCVSLAAPTAAEITAAVNLTPLMLSLNASTTGNTVPTPSLDTLFETSIAGTVQGAFSADFYRDDEDDLAWETLPRSTRGFFFLTRFGGSGALGKPIATESVEVWPTLIVSRAMSNGGNNTVLSFTVTASIPREPVEDAVVAA